MFGGVEIPSSRCLRARCFAGEAAVLGCGAAETPQNTAEGLES